MPFFEVNIQGSYKYMILYSVYFNSLSDEKTKSDTVKSLTWKINLCRT